MSESMQPPVVQSAKFSDIDEWCAAAAGWNLHFQQLDGGSLAATLDRAILPEFVVQTLSLSRRFHQSGFAPDGALTFGVPGNAQLIRWYGREPAPTAIMNFNRGSGFDCVSERGFTVQTFTVLQKSFLEGCHALGCTIDAEGLLYGQEKFNLPPEQLKQLKSIGSSLMHCLQGGQQMTRAVRDLAADIRYLLAMSLVYSRMEPSNSTRVARQHSVDRALELIHATSGLVTVPEICKHASASARSLSRGFGERFGISTKQYAVTRRLSEVRRALAGGRTSITDAACDYGFWHLGRFAADYCRMFGEQPSATLRRQRRDG
jgi:AraC family transcriptional regulator, ethanolamine operon transcriptional activator